MMKLKQILKSYIGNKAFYKMALSIALPMIIQNTITNLVNMLDTMMVGSLGSEAVAAVGAVNQFVFIFNLATFGAVSGAGIFAAQYNGRGDNNGVRNTMRIKLVCCLLLGILGMGVLIAFGDPLIKGFLNKSEEMDLALAIEYSKEYLAVIILGFIPFAISQAYASTLRETEQTKPPMVASLISVVTNFVLNGLLIFGLLGFPALGVQGAAIATSISRFAEFAVLVIWTHSHKKKCPFIKNIYSKFHIPKALAKQVAIKGIPIWLNELFWSASVTALNFCYSNDRTEVLNALNISFSLQNLLSVSYFALSSSIAIMVGNLLGAGEFEKAKDTDRKLLAFSVFMGGCMMGIQLILSQFYPMIYTEVSDAERQLATYTMACFALTMPAAALATSTYYTIRSGGLAFVTMLFDSVYAWVIVIPVAALLSFVFKLDYKIMLPLVLVTENLKLLPGLILVHKGIWIKQIKVE